MSSKQRPTSKDRYKMISVAISYHDNDVLKMACERSGYTASEYIRIALRRYNNHRAKADPVLFDAIAAANKRNKARRAKIQKAMI